MRGLLAGLLVRSDDVDIDLTFASVPCQPSRAPGNIQIRQNKARGTTTYAVSLLAALTSFSSS